MIKVWLTNCWQKIVLLLYLVFSLSEHFMEVRKTNVLLVFYILFLPILSLYICIRGGWGKIGGMLYFKRTIFLANSQSKFLRKKDVFCGTATLWILVSAVIFRGAQWFSVFTLKSDLLSCYLSSTTD